MVFECDNAHLTRFLVNPLREVGFVRPVDDKVNGEKQSNQAMVILYAEDDPEDVEVFHEAVKALDSTIILQHVPDGADVFSFLENTIILPAYIFLDINMPLLGGKECLRRLKQNKDFRSIPVVIYTTSKRPKEKEECINLGAVDYLIKPNTFSEVYKMLFKFFKR